MKSDSGSEISSGLTRGSLKLNIKHAHTYTEADVDTWGQDLEIDENSVALNALQNVNIKASRVFGLRLPGGGTHTTPTNANTEGAESLPLGAKRQSILDVFHNTSSDSTYHHHPPVHPSIKSTIQSERRTPHSPHPHPLPTTTGEHSPSSRPVTPEPVMSPEYGHDKPKVEGREIKQVHIHHIHICIQRILLYTLTNMHVYDV